MSDNVIRLPWWLRVRYWRAVFAEKSYLIRPYDAVADRRRWFWRPSAPCARYSVGLTSAVYDAENNRVKLTIAPVAENEETP